MNVSFPISFSKNVLYFNGSVYGVSGVNETAPALVSNTLTNMTVSMGGYQGANLSGRNVIAVIVGV